MVVESGILSSPQRNACGPPLNGGSLLRAAVAEGVGTAFLLIAVVGSGILGERLCSGNIGVALLANSLSTAAALYAIIEWLAPISGAHFNPLVTLVLFHRGDIGAD